MPAVGPAASFTVGGQLDGVAVASAASVWAVGTSSLGNPLAVRWDGRAWTRVPTPGGDRLTSPSGGSLNGVAALSARDAWAVGAGMYNKALIEHWDGRAWTLVYSPALESIGLDAVAATSPGNAWAVGRTLCPGQGLMTVIEHWDRHRLAAGPHSGSRHPHGRGRRLSYQRLGGRILVGQRNRRNRALGRHRLDLASRVLQQPFRPRLPRRRQRQS